MPRPFPPVLSQTQLKEQERVRPALSPIQQAMGRFPRGRTIHGDVRSDPFRLVRQFSKSQTQGLLRYIEEQQAQARMRADARKRGRTDRYQRRLSEARMGAREREIKELGRRLQEIDKLLKEGQ